MGLVIVQVQLYCYLFYGKCLSTDIDIRVYERDIEAIIRQNKEPELKKVLHKSFSVLLWLGMTQDRIFTL